LAQLLTLDGRAERQVAKLGAAEGAIVNKRVAIGIPVCGGADWTLKDSLQGLQVYGDRIEIRAGKPDRPIPIVEAHNRIVKTFLETDRGWLLNHDMDAILHPATLLRLMAWDVPIVGPLCFTRYTPVTPTVSRGRARDKLFKNHFQPGWKLLLDEVREWIRQHPGLWTNEPVCLDPIPQDSLWPVAFTGAHAMLIRRDVLEAMEPPWFVRTTPKNQQGTGLELGFCERALALGFKTYVDMSTVAGHKYARNRSIGCIDYMAYDSIFDWNNRRWRIAQQGIVNE